MQGLRHLTPSRDLAGAWCDSSLLLSSVLEALSFATPALEKFFIRAVLQALDAPANDAARVQAQARAFVGEEASHSAAHRRFNLALLGYLGSPPPGLRPLEAALERATGALSLPTRLIAVEVMEHASALLSAHYLRREGRLAFGCAFAQHLFAQHAREEIGHRAVIHALAGVPRVPQRSVRALAWAALAFAGAGYLCLAVPWIMFRKRRTRRNINETCA